MEKFKVYFIDIQAQPMGTLTLTARDHLLAKEGVESMLNGLVFIEVEHPYPETVNPFKNNRYYIRCSSIAGFTLEELKEDKNV